MINHNQNSLVPEPTKTERATAIIERIKAERRALIHEIEINADDLAQAKRALALAKQLDSNEPIDIMEVAQIHIGKGGAE